EAAAREAGYDLLVATQRPDDPRRPIRQPLGPHNTDGLLIFTDNADTAELGRFHRQGFPIVLLYRSAPEGLPIPGVIIEHRLGGQQLAEHLIETHGRRRIAFLRGPDGNEDAYWREQGYRASLAAHGIPFDPALVAGGQFEEQPSRAAVERWLAAGVPF